MCGIFGIYSDRVNALELKSITYNSLKKIKYRGPDETKVSGFGQFFSGVNRLSIKAIKNGSQPIEDSRYILGFNGEIFNYNQLINSNNFIKKEVNSEVKLLLKLWIKKKERIINDIKGQFALFIYDKLKKEVYLFRDRYGIRPLFYYLNNKTFIFSSEIKSIVYASKDSFVINEESLKQISMFWTNIGSQTSIKKVFTLEPGTYLKWNLEGIKIKRYFEDPILTECSKNINSTLSLKENLYNGLSQAVKNQIHGEVEFGCYLSGGIDSSVLAYLLSKVSSGKKINTFSISFKDKEYDESCQQQKVANFLNSNHHTIKINKKEISKYFPKVIDHCETLLFRTAPVPMYLLSRYVKKNGIKVIYSGEGSDEILLGYDIFFENRIRQFWKRDPSSNLRPLLLRRLYSYLPQFANSKYYNLTKDFYKKTLTANDDFFYSHLVRWSQYQQVSTYFQFNNNYNVEKRNLEKLKMLLPKNFNNLKSDTKAQYLELTTLMSNYLLSSQGDRMLMANSIEGRYPFIDEDFVNICANIDSQTKAPTINSKQLFRSAFKDKLPDYIINQPKIAYQAPEAQCFVGENYMSDNVVELLDNIKDLHLINRKNFKDLIAKIQNPNSTRRLGFRENMAFMLCLSYFNLQKSLNNWSKI